MKLTLWHPLRHQPGITFKKTSMKNSLNAKLVNWKRSYSKHPLLCTARATELLQRYLTKTLFTTNSVRFFFLSLPLSLPLLLAFLHRFSSLFTFGKDTYRMKYFSGLLLGGLRVLYAWQLLAKFSSIVWRIWANRLTFVLPGIMKWFFAGILVRWIAGFRLVAGKNFGDNPFHFYRCFCI